jgi:hypothetical protein
VNRSYPIKTHGNSIRCLQNEITGCTDPEACNYDETATADNGSCEYEFDCAGTCGGDLEWDCGGVCGGDNSTALSCCGLPFYDDCTTDCYEDSMGVCCIEEEADYCGMCFGDNSSCGDVNLDGYLDVLDVVITINIVLVDGYDEIGDMNGDGQLNILDIVILINLILNGEGVIMDIDGNVYLTVQIGEQLWMAENLKVTHYNNGDEIPYPSNEDFGSFDEGQYGVYDNDPANADIYGNLYNWAVVNG